MHMNCVGMREEQSLSINMAIWHTNCPETLKINCTVIRSIHGEQKLKEHEMRIVNIPASNSPNSSSISLEVTVINLPVWRALCVTTSTYIFHLHCGLIMYWGMWAKAVPNFAEKLHGLTISVVKLERQIGASSCLGLKQIQPANIVITVCGNWHNQCVCVGVCECLYVQWIMCSVCLVHHRTASWSHTWNILAA